MKALKNVDLNNVVFLDIETAKLVEKLEVGTSLFDSWKYKISREKDLTNPTDEELITLFDNRASLYAEFSKIVCISIGKIVKVNVDNVESNVLKVFSYSQEKELDLLIAFNKGMNKLVVDNPKTSLCFHCGKSYDMPFIMRRCIVNQLEIPSIIDVANLKPWEITAIDTYELWKGSGFNSGSLLSIATALGIDSPKDDIDGSETSEVYYQEGGLKRIVSYCEKDILTVANILMRMMYKPLVQIG
jgi:hypothetical protein